MKDWDEKRVSQFVRSLGKSKVWAGYADTCLQEGVDGSTLLYLTLEDLVDLGFKKLHGRTVLCNVKEKAALPSAEGKHRKNSAPMWLPLTDEESKGMMRFAHYHDTVAKCQATLTTAIAKLDQDKDRELQKLIKKVRRAPLQHVIRMRLPCSLPCAPAPHIACVAHPATWLASGEPGARSAGLGASAHTAANPGAPRPHQGQARERVRVQRREG